MPTLTVDPRFLARVAITLPEHIEPIAESFVFHNLAEVNNFDDRHNATPTTIVIDWRIEQGRQRLIPILGDELTKKVRKHISSLYSGRGPAIFTCPITEQELAEVRQRLIDEFEIQQASGELHEPADHPDIFTQRFGED